MATLSRREILFGPFRRARQAYAADLAERSAEVDVVAIISGRDCLAYQRTFCSTCYERCPEEGAIVMRDGMPMVMTDKCTGCRVCHDVCPAPVNAIRIMPRPRSARHG